MSLGRNLACFFSSAYSRLASMNRTSLVVFPLWKIRMAAGMPVPKKRFAGRPMTASSWFSSISF